jgi:hypothetical protein
VVCALAFAGTVNAQAPETDALFRAATDALVENRPQDAMVNLEALGDRGVVDPVVSFNRALAYVGRVRAGAEQPGDLGRAAHGFEEARELSHDSALVNDATRALATVRAEVAKRRARAADPVEIDTGISLGRSIVRLLPENGWAALVVLASLSLCVGILLRSRAREHGPLSRARVTGTMMSVLGACVFLIGGLVAVLSRRDRVFGRDAVVIAPSARLLDAQHVVIAARAPLAEAARLQLLDESGDFAYVRAGNVEGWLPSSAILPLAR